MNPITSFNPNQQYLDKYLNLSPGSQKTSESKSISYESIELAVEYTRTKIDIVELSEGGKRMLSTSESMKILYKSTTVKMEDAAGTEGAEETGTDASLADYFSPENTAQRIVDFARSFFPAYGDNHADEHDPTKLQDDFTKMMRDAIEQGFKEARAILGDFYEQDTPGFITDTIDQTYDLVQQKLDALFGDDKAESEPTEPTQ